MSIKLNVNDIVKCKLTEEGLQVLKDDIEARCRRMPALRDKIKMPCPDLDGFYKFSFWDFCCKFSPTMKLGQQAVFTDLTIED